MQVLTHPDLTIVEGDTNQSLVTDRRDANRLVEQCWEHDAQALLLYPANLPAEFFDLSSGLAGELLQKLRNYQLRLAIVDAEGTAPLSTYFQDMAGEERRSGYFGLFASRAEAIAWLGAHNKAK